jgi:hypothetical protein
MEYHIYDRALTNLSVERLCDTLNFDPLIDRIMYSFLCNIISIWLMRSDQLKLTI